MFQHQGMWLPDGEKHFQDWMTKNGELVNGRGTYQVRKWRACLPWIKRRRAAVDVGAHVGFWSIQMARHFHRVEAFEPVETFRACWVENLELSGSDDGCGDGRLNLHDMALGAVAGKVAMKIPTLPGGIDTGGTHVDPTAEAGNVEIRTLDSFGFEDVDFVKIDCEGYEHHVIDGARETLARCRPCVIVEQKPHKLGPNFGITGTPAVDRLVAMGAKQRAVLSGDYILSWD